MTLALRVKEEVRAALDEGRAVVALESSVLAQGLPIPANREAAERMYAAIRSRDAVAAITAVVHGVPAVGLGDEELERFLRRDGIRKTSSRDLPWACATGLDAATTVAGTLVIARAAGIEVMATGGIGGVHREPPFDESGDLVELSRTSVIVVCSGAKSILDLPATLERLESLGVMVIGWRTEEFPGFYTTSTGLPLSVSAGDPEHIARAFRAKQALGIPGAVLVVQPPPAEEALPRDVVDRAVKSALERARRENVRGSAVTPFLLAAVGDETDGRSRRVNLALLEHNARLAAEIAVALSAQEVASTP